MKQQEDTAKAQHTAPPHSTHVTKQSREEDKAEAEETEEDEEARVVLIPFLISFHFIVLIFFVLFCCLVLIAW